jgi:hypothetical protein
MHYGRDYIEESEKKIKLVYLEDLVDLKIFKLK